MHVVSFIDFLVARFVADMLFIIVSIIVILVLHKATITSSKANQIKSNLTRKRGRARPRGSSVTVAT